MQPNSQILNAAHEAWLAMASLRNRRDRYRRYTYGDQWSDPDVDSHGRPCTEGDAMSVNGKKPLTNNLIRRMVKSVVGRFRSQRSDEFNPSATLRDIHSRNVLSELDARALEEFLISGMAVQRVCAERRPRGSGVWVDNVSPAHFFVNGVRDPRGWDTELIGMLHDWSISEVIMRFAEGSRQKALDIRELYSSIASGSHPSLFGDAGVHGPDFFCAPSGRCRVIEVWTLECREQMRLHDPLDASATVAAPLSAGQLERINRHRLRAAQPEIAARWELATCWHCRYFAPDGTVLSEFDSPYAHRSHPFVAKLYPLIDGEVHSLVEDVVDQQRYVNRLITLMDHMMGTAAKGVLLFPVNAKIDGQPWEEVARMWASCDGLIPYRDVPGGKEPHQVSTSVGDIGVRDLLALQIKMFEDVSGVGGAMLGKTPSNSTGAARYESELRNSAISIADIIDTFTIFLNDRDEKAVNVF